MKPTYLAPGASASVLVVEPPVAIVELDDTLRAQCGVADGTDNDDLLQTLVTVAQAEIEPTDSWIGRSFGQQTLEARFCEWGCWDILLPFPPVTSLISVKYDDADGVEQTIDPSDYRLLGAGTAGPRVSLTTGQSWPVARSWGEAIRVQYYSGYDPADPRLEPARQAIRFAVSRFFNARGDGGTVSRIEIPGVESKHWFVSDAIRSEVDMMQQRLLSRYRVWEV